MKKTIAWFFLIALCVMTFVGCATATVSGGNELTAAKNYLHAMYKDKAVATASDYQLVGVLNINGTTYSVEWTTNSEEAKVVPADKMVTIDVNEKTPVEVAYVLTATIKAADGTAVSLSYDHVIPAFKELSWNDYVAAEKDATLVVKGVVTGLMAKSKGNSSNCIYFQDADGGYYAYNMGTDPIADDKIAIGMTIRVTGSKDTYSGTYEIMNGTVEILDATANPVAPVDYTEKYKNASSLKDPNLVAQQSMLVTVKGVEITGQDTASGYYKFKMGDLESYVRISSSVCPIDKTEQAKFIAGHSEHLGWTANVTGILCVYDGAFYLSPVSADAIEYVGLPALDDAGMVAFEKGNLTFAKSSVFADEVIDLASAGASYDAVQISWASDSEYAVVADGKLAITMPKADAVVKLTASIKSGSVVETKDFELKLVVRELSYEEIVASSYALAEGAALDGTYRLFGTITSIDTEYSEKYGNITVTIQVGSLEEQKIQCFRLKGEGSATLAVGDAITVEGVIKNYKGTVEFDAGCVLVGMGEIISQKKAVETAYALGEGEAMASKSVLKGVISSIDTEYSEKYGNITVTMIVDGLADNPIQCFRLKGEGAATLAVGDEIAVLGLIKNYKGTVEFDAGCVLVSDFIQARTLLAAYALEEGAKMAGTKTLTGKVVSVDTAYSEQYGNITVTIIVDGLEDYPMMCYRLKGEGAATLAVDSVITVSGVIKNYKGTVEFDAGCTLV